MDLSQASMPHYILRGSRSKQDRKQLESLINGEPPKKRQKHVAEFTACTTASSRQEMKTAKTTCASPRPSNVFDIKKTPKSLKEFFLLIQERRKQATAFLGPQGVPGDVSKAKQGTTMQLLLYFQKHFVEDMSTTCGFKQVDANFIIIGADKSSSVVSSTLDKQYMVEQAFLEMYQRSLQTAMNDKTRDGYNRVPLWMEIEEAKNLVGPNHEFLPLNTKAIVWSRLYNGYVMMNMLPTPWMFTHPETHKEFNLGHVCGYEFVSNDNVTREKIKPVLDALEAQYGFTDAPFTVVENNKAVICC